MVVLPTKNPTANQKIVQNSIYIAEVFGTKFCSPVPNPVLSQIQNQNQIRDRDSDLILNKTKSNTETQFWF